MSAETLLRPIIGIENRTAQEVFDIMSDRIRRTPPAPMEAGPVNSTGPDTHPPQPDALPGDLRERVARLILDFPFNINCEREVPALADAILSIIQSERGGGMTQSPKALVHSGFASIPSELVARLEVVLKEHNRLASWNRQKDRPERVAFHHDAALTIRDAIAVLRAKAAA